MHLLLMVSIETVSGSSSLATLWTINQCTVYVRSPRELSDEYTHHMYAFQHFDWHTVQSQ